MLHIATVHFNTPRWIPIQMRELQRNMSMPYATWASFEGIDEAHRASFDHVLEHDGSHADKLNRLAHEISCQAAGDDLVMFLDGDAFPIRDPGPLIESGLTAAPLVAVRREENEHDPYPHPCFCVTRIATWRELGGDWGHETVPTGRGSETVADVGTKLLRQLELSGTAWTEVLRSNRRNPHPVFFGIYGDTVYHHGAGFRQPVSRADKALIDVTSPDRHAEVARVALRNLQQSQDLFSKIARDDPDWTSELI